MELRKYSRFFPQCEILVALVSDEGNVLTGSLVDLSLSGLAFNYMSWFKCRIPKHTFCGVMIKCGRAPFSDPIVCEVIHETPFLAGSCHVSMERCGIRFKRILTVSAMESLLSMQSPPNRDGQLLHAASPVSKTQDTSRDCRKSPNVSILENLHTVKSTAYVQENLI